MHEQKNKPATSVAAYEARERIRRYDADMEVMHPNRGKMADVAIDFLAACQPAPAHILDLGCGTGFVAGKLLARFDDVRVTALDGAQAMLDMSRVRLAAQASRLDLCRAEFGQIGKAGFAPGSFDAIFSAYALHHLSRDDKAALLARCRRLLKPGGWFFNADIVINPSDTIEDIMQSLRAEGIVARARPGDARFADAAGTSAWLAQMEAAEGDQPLGMQEDLALYAEAGFARSALLWAEYREMVMAAQK